VTNYTYIGGHVCTRYSYSLVCTTCAVCTYKYTTGPAAHSLTE